MARSAWRRNKRLAGHEKGAPRGAFFGEREPERVLRDVLPLLRPAGGSVVVSLPNVANISVRLSLLFGRFEYADRGIMDRTHVRFYTRKTAVELLESNGYRIVGEYYSIIPLDRGLRVKPRGFIDRAGRNAMWRLFALVAAVSLRSVPYFIDQT